MKRKQNFQTISWFWDIHQRKRLNMDPPYQRRSVWNQSYRDYFVDTILLGYPAPAIFLYEQIDPDGQTCYHVVDGKQRLSALFDFANSEFPVPDTAERSDLREKHFRDLGDDVKREFWSYQFSVEYVPTEDNAVINNIFDRINRNVAKLSPQELRHARYSGEFITACEEFAAEMEKALGMGFPYIAPKSRRQMKDIELAAHLLLLVEGGPRGYSSLDLDKAFSGRDEAWELKEVVGQRARDAINCLKSLLDCGDNQPLVRTRFRNQTDFYSLFGAVDKLLKAGVTVDASTWAERLLDFATQVENEDVRAEEPGLRAYYDASRSASNDAGPRKRRIGLIGKVLLGETLELEEESEDGDSE